MSLDEQIRRIWNQLDQRERLQRIAAAVGRFLLWIAAGFTVGRIVQAVWR